jgi:catechol 2,3-dioxygenase-like lactoylglutathione lyase family enzyme
MRDEATRTRPEESDDGCGTSTTVHMSWPRHLRVSQVRIARPTDRLDEVVAFYRDGIGLAELASFRGHAGYDGVMLGLPGAEYHLEFTRREQGSPGAAPSRDNVLVLYLPEPGAVEAVAARLKGIGHTAVQPENPYWAAIGITFEDPDSWRVVLVRAAGFADTRPQTAEGTHHGQ